MQPDAPTYAVDGDDLAGGGVRRAECSVHGSCSESCPGQGKTNLLETIFVVAALRSFRTARLTDLIAFGAERARLGAPVS